MLAGSEPFALAGLHSTTLELKKLQEEVCGEDFRSKSLEIRVVGFVQTKMAAPFEKGGWGLVKGDRATKAIGSRTRLVGARASMRLRRPPLNRSVL